MEGLYALEHLSRHELTGEPLDCDRVNFFSKILVEPEGAKPDISKHFDMVTTHRGYAKAAFELWTFWPGVLTDRAGMTCESP